MSCSCGDRIKIDDFEMVEVNITNTGEHMGVIKRGIWVVKKSRCVIPTPPPFRYYHKILIVHLVYFVIMLLNNVPATKDILSKFLPLEILISRQINAKI